MDAGILLGRICMGGLAQIEVRDADDLLGLRSVEVSTDEPLLSCIGSQYAGWPISRWETILRWAADPCECCEAKRRYLLRMVLLRRLNKRLEF